MPEVAADELFGQMVSVALGRVDDIDPAVRSSPQDGIDLPWGEILSPFAAELIGADPYY